MIPLEYWKEAEDWWSGTKKADDVILGAMILQAGTGLARNWEEVGEFLIHCAVDFPYHWWYNFLMVQQLSALFSQLGYKLELHLLSCFGRRLLSFKHQTWGAPSCLSWPGQVVRLHIHLSAWQPHHSSPLLKFIAGFWTEIWSSWKVAFKVFSLAGAFKSSGLKFQSNSWKNVMFSGLRGKTFLLLPIFWGQDGKRQVWEAELNHINSYKL